MRRIITAGNGMNIVGQGLWIILFTVPAAAAAVAAHCQVPDLVRIPLPPMILIPLGGLLALIGLGLWSAAVGQLLAGFGRGKLITDCAYGVSRNPIYSSVAFLVLPGVSLLTMTWVYLPVSAVLCLAVWIFIRREERDLLRVYGDEYRSYTERVPRFLPFGQA